MQLFSLPAAGGAIALAVGLGIPTQSAAHMLQAPCDSVTAGGWVFDAGFASWSSFGAHGGCKNGEFWGHVNFVDHLNGFHLNSTRITGYLYDPAMPNARDICGWARINDQPQEVMFRMRLVDNGEPGAADMAGIVIDNWYAPQRFYTVPTRDIGNVPPGKGGGNVQLHKANRSNTANPGYFALREYEMCGDLSSP